MIHPVAESLLYNSVNQYFKLNNGLLFIAMIHFKLCHTRWAFLGTFKVLSSRITSSLTSYSINVCSLSLITRQHTKSSMKSFNRHYLLSFLEEIWTLCSNKHSQSSSSGRLFITWYPYKNSKALFKNNFRYL